MLVWISSCPKPVALISSATLADLVVSDVTSATAVASGALAGCHVRVTKSPPRGWCSPMSSAVCAGDDAPGPAASTEAPGRADIDDEPLNGGGVPGAMPDRGFGVGELIENTGVPAAI